MLDIGSWQILGAKRSGVGNQDSLEKRLMKRFVAFQERAEVAVAIGDIWAEARQKKVTACLAC